MLAPSEKEGQKPTEPKVGEPLSADIRIEPFSYGGYWPDGMWTPFTVNVGNTGMAVVPTVYESYDSMDLRFRIKEGKVY